MNGMMGWMAACSTGLLPSIPDPGPHTAASNNTVDVLGAQAADLADEAQQGADAAHANCTDLLSSFSILVRGWAACGARPFVDACSAMTKRGAAAMGMGMAGPRQ